MSERPFPQVLRTRIKFCGLTRMQDALAAAALGVDALGFVLVPQSPRWISPSAAAAIRRQLPPLLTGVALFRNAEADFVREALRQLGPVLLQFHGDEPPDYCAMFGLPYVKAVAMAEPQDLPKLAATYADAQALLLDGHGASSMGGSGQVFDWKKVAPVNKPLILAGGLNAMNVADSIASVRPYAVDVSSGIEATPGQKDVEKMRAFVSQVRRADHELNS